MCDEFTEADIAGLTRRSFGALSGAAALTGMAMAGSAYAAPDAALTEKTVQIITPAGTADAFFVHPAHGVHPGVVMWPDIAGLRDAFMVMGRRLAAQGYAVLVVNQYYRNGPAPVLSSFAEWRTPPGQEKLKPMIAAITPATITTDATAYVNWLDQQPAVDKKRKIGSNGYCMGGPFAVRTAAAMPARVGAAATLHGANLVNDKPDSPHKLLASTHANYLFAIARGDDARAPGDKDALRAAAAAANLKAEVEVYPAEHGWCALDSPSFDQAQADRAFGRLTTLYATL